MIRLSVSPAPLRKQRLHLIFVSKQRPRLIAADSFEADLNRAVEPDRRTDRSEHCPVLLLDIGAPTQRNDRADHVAAGLNSRPFKASKLRFAKLGEDLLNRFAGSRGDQLIQIEEGVFEVTSERPSNGGLARTHKPD